VRLQFGACPQSGSQSSPAARFRAPSPACPIHAGSYGYQRVDLWTPVLAAKGSLSSSTNTLSVIVKDPLTNSPVGGATVTLSGQGRTVASGKTASDGAVKLDSSGCSKGGLTSALASCGVMVMKAGYLNCSFAVMVVGEGQCSGDYAGATAAASITTIDPATIVASPGGASLSGTNLTAQNLQSLQLLTLSASLCPTLDGKSCLPANQVRPANSALMDIVTVTSNGAPVGGATVTVSGQNSTAVTNASGVAVISHQPCYPPGSQVSQVGKAAPVRTPVPCGATVSKPGYQTFGTTLP